ncbi:hypothetical protein TNCV_2545491 [Trichonephila clavipes]|nr:hypothetical protein TNCV_2545491 [Trichonephila clavipes]
MQTRRKNRFFRNRSFCEWIHQVTIRIDLKIAPFRKESPSLTRTPEPVPHYPNSHYSPTCGLGAMTRFNMHQPFHTASLQCHQDWSPQLDSAYHEYVTMTTRLPRPQIPEPWS